MDCIRNNTVDNHNINFHNRPVKKKLTLREAVSSHIVEVSDFYLALQTLGDLSTITKPRDWYSRVQKVALLVLPGLLLRMLRRQTIRLPWGAMSGEALLHPERESEEWREGNRRKGLNFSSVCKYIYVKPYFWSIQQAKIG